MDGLRLGRHSALILDSLMIGHHLSISDFCSAAKACGVICAFDGTSKLWPSSFCRIFADRGDEISWRWSPAAIR